ncbi:complement decay-accelerating factor isoform X5 [Amphiprion ocellaris]|uniref:complement decay-accelerating factor isoform X5 n=1 Tax=Amphiprion ocellaris TaxID=80972 RepID=UPI002410F8C4|nr:complement decay-accelerating factor isoform X5 [Amphiprion ocellaris]
MEASLDTCGQRTVQSLLLLYLLVVKAAADCPKPQGRENIVLTNKALLMNDFPEGVEVTLECANGYDRESGSGTITCIDEKWTEPDLTCKKKDCGPPQPQPNMSFNISAGTLFGAVIKAICDKGYKITGPAYKQCYPTGWSGRPKCNIVTCAKPPEVTNGRISWDAQDLPKYGEIIQYTCDEGYTLIGEDSIVCSATGKYDSQPPECKGNHDEAVDVNQDFGYLPVIISVIVVSLVVCIVVFFIHKFLLRRKGSYDTREDLKPELLQFQNL